MYTLIGELRQAIRSLRRSPGFFLACVAALGVGVGLTAAMFSIVYGVLMRGLAVPNADRIGVLYRNAPAQGIRRQSLPIQDYLDYRAQQRTFTRLGAYTSGSVNVSGEGPAARLDVAWVSLLIAKPLAAAGKIQALAITGPRRFVAWPELATFAEQGFPGFEMPVWGGAYLPAGTPKPIVERLSREIVEVLRNPEVSEKLIAMGQLPIGNTPAEFAENYRRDFPRWEALIRASGAKVE